MILAVDITDGRGLITKSVVNSCQRRQGNGVFVVVNAFNQLYITNKTKRFSFKSGRALQVAKLIKEDWPIVLQRGVRHFQKSCTRFEITQKSIDFSDFIEITNDFIDFKYL